MESNGDMSQAQLREQLRVAVHGETAGWTSVADQWWWAPLYAAWAAALTGVLAGLDGRAESTGVLVLIAAGLGLATLERRVRGVGARGMPPGALVGPVTLLLVGVGVLALGTIVVAYYAPTWVAVLLAGVATWVMVTVYGRWYAAAARRMVARTRPQGLRA